jgi:hypothetical protein
MTSTCQPNYVAIPESLGLPGQFCCAAEIHYHPPQVLVGLAQNVVGVLPFGAPLAAAIGVIYSLALQAAENSVNCQQLLALVKICDRQLARLQLNKVSSGSTTTCDEDVKESLYALGQLVSSDAGIGGGRVGIILEFETLSYPTFNSWSQLATCLRCIWGAGL